MSEAFNGWKNRETFHVSVWWTNDKPRYAELCKHARHLRFKYGAIAYIELGKWLQEFTTDYLDETDSDPLGVDLQSAALARVSWQEIARHILGIVG